MPEYEVLKPVAYVTKTGVRHLPAGIVVDMPAEDAAVLVADGRLSPVDPPAVAPPPAVGRRGDVADYAMSIGVDAAIALKSDPAQLEEAVARMEAVRDE